MNDTVINTMPLDTSREHRLQQLKMTLHEQLISGVDYSVIRSVDPQVLRNELRAGAERLCSMHSDLLSQADRKRLIDDLVDETLGLGPLQGNRTLLAYGLRIAFDLCWSTRRVGDGRFLGTEVTHGNRSGGGD